MAYLTIFTCVDVVSLLVKEVDVTNQWLRDIGQQELSIYQPKMLHEMYVSLTLEI